MTATQNENLRLEAKVQLLEGMRFEYLEEMVYRRKSEKKLDLEFETRCALIGVELSSVKCGSEEFERRKSENCL